MKATTPLILLPAAMLMGNSIAYICLAVIGLCSVSELRDQKCRGLLRHCFTENKWPWLVLSAFSLVFIIIQSVSPIADFAYVSELKWVGILILGLVPTAILIRELPSTKVDKISLLITILLTCFCVAVALIQVATKADPLQYLFTEGEGDARGRGLLRNPIPFGHLMACFFLIGCVVAALGATHSLWGRRAVLLGIGVGSVCFVGLLASQTRGAWAALPIAALAGLVCLPWRSKRVWFGAMSLFGLIGLAALLLTPSIRSRFASGFDPSAEANRQRLEHWHANWEILKDNPFGIGYSANDVLIESVFEELGYEVNAYMWHSHNEFVEIVVATGWLGLVLYLGFCIMLLWQTLREIGLSRDRLWPTFLLNVSFLIQVFLNLCALTDQMNTQGRMLLCFAWALVMVAPIDRRLNPGG